MIHTLTHVPVWGRWEISGQNVDSAPPHICEALHLKNGIDVVALYIVSASHGKCRPYTVYHRVSTKYS